MMYDWGSTIYAKSGETWKHAIYIGENENFRDPMIDGKHLVIFEGEDEVEETSDIRKACFCPKPNKNGFSWGEWVEAWDDEIDAEHPYIGIFLAIYTDVPGENQPLYSVIPDKFQKVPSEGFLHCKKIIDD